MIDLATEPAISFADAADTLPRRRGGKKTHVATLYRWATVGCRGVVLETIQIGGTKCTSRGAMQRFFDSLTVVRSGPSVAVRTPAARQRAMEQADRELAKAGI